jgi:hypothetical protein
MGAFVKKHFSIALDGFTRNGAVIPFSSSRCESSAIKVTA